MTFSYILLLVGYKKVSYKSSTSSYICLQAIFRVLNRVMWSSWVPKMFLFKSIGSWRLLCPGHDRILKACLNVKLKISRYSKFLKSGLDYNWSKCMPIRIDQQRFECVFITIMNIHECSYLYTYDYQVLLFSFIEKTEKWPEFHVFAIFWNNQKL